MGVNQSSDCGESSGIRGQGQGRGKTCYYDVLGVPRDATDEEIKRSYRRKALELHPDRNYGNVQASTEQFADVQSAYEVLSDRWERTWYDNHRSTILEEEQGYRGNQCAHNARVTTVEDVLRMFKRFNSQIEFSDAATGFFGGLREAFEVLAHEEEMACEWEGADFVRYPSFGCVGDSYDATVKPFYSRWTNFATKKTFSWKDIYRYAEAPDRKVRRLMEKENKRLREEGIREFNDAIRSLVAFVKKRDPRVRVTEMNDGDRQRILREAASAQAARSKAANQIRTGPVNPVADWAQSKEPFERGLSDEEQEEPAPAEELECVVCKKSFKSEKQYGAHERSKKHVKAVQQIRKDMRQDEADLGLGSVQSLTPSSPLEQHITDSAHEWDINGLPTASPSEHCAQIHHSRTTLHQVRPVYTRVARSASYPSTTAGSDGNREDHEYNPRDSVELHTLCNKVEDDGMSRHPTNAELNEVSDQLAAETLAEDLPKTGKAKAKRAKKAAQKAVAGGAGPMLEFRCITCQAAFPSKSRMFNHIKDFGHAQPGTRAAKGRREKRR